VFQIAGASNVNPALKIQHGGTGPGGSFEMLSGSNSNSALILRHDGTGRALEVLRGRSEFNGDVIVHGTLTKPAGSFKIDHPLEPDHKYLSHSFVESPDMKNVYDGNVTLDASGRGTLELPDYFEALNQDFRYQLTAVGAPGPNLYIARGYSRTTSGSPEGGPTPTSPGR
jgi:hypothetical protein